MSKDLTPEQKAHILNEVERERRKHLIYRLLNKGISISAEASYPFYWLMGFFDSKLGHNLFLQKPYGRFLEDETSFPVSLIKKKDIDPTEKYSNRREFIEDLVAHIPPQCQETTREAMAILGLTNFREQEEQGKKETTILEFADYEPKVLETSIKKIEELMRIDTLGHKIVYFMPQEYAQAVLYLARKDYPRFIEWTEKHMKINEFATCDIIAKLFPHMPKYSPQAIRRYKHAIRTLTENPYEIYDDNLHVLAQYDPTAFSEIYLKVLNKKRSIEFVARCMVSLAATLADETLIPIEDEEYKFIVDYLNSPLVKVHKEYELEIRQAGDSYYRRDERNGDLKSIDDIVAGLKYMVKDPDRDYARLRKTLKQGDAMDLAEILEFERFKIPGYTLLRKIGQGSYKKVYKVVPDELPDEEVALLIVDVNAISEKAQYYLDKLGRTALENCRGEAARLTRLNKTKSKYIPAILSTPLYDEKQGIYYWTEEFVDIRLDNFLQGKPPDEHYATFMLQNVAKALHTAHKLGYFHGDLNLVNIGIYRTNTSKDKDPRCVVLDWGICSTIPADPTETQGREFLGYRLTRAPEVYAGEIPTAKADIWALGVVAYRLYSGEYPFQWSFTGTSEEWHALSIEEKQKYEDEVHQKIKEYCADPKKFRKSFEAYDENLPGIKFQKEKLLFMGEEYSRNYALRMTICRCLEPDPEKRPSALEILNLLQYFKILYDNQNNWVNDLLKPQKYKEFGGKL